MSKAHPLTREQSAALAVEGASVALRSGAGCGKTTVLTERFVAGLDRWPLRAIVALTFTRKAARQLRDRVRYECRRRLDSGDDPARWRAVLRGLEAAPIQTFHGFCAGILRRHAVEAGVEPGFAELDAPAATALRDESLARCLRRWLAASDEDLIGLAVAFGLGATREALAGLIDGPSRSELAEWAARSPGAVLAGWDRAWAEQALPALLRGLVRRAGPCLDLLRVNVPTHPKMLERRADLLDRLPRLEALADPIGALRELHERAKVQGTAKEHWESEGIYESVGKRFGELRDDIKSTLKAAEVVVADVDREAAVHGLRLARLAAEAAAEYGRAKAEAGALDFHDLLTRTRDLLLDDPAARASIADAIGLVLVDEFQDTDPIQAEILELLAGEAFGGGRLFLVGDAKQSIYRFRGARPGIFQEFQSRFPEAGRLPLSENFRSTAGVLDFVNALFADAFDEADHALRPGKPTPDLGDAPAVEFVWADESGGAKVSAEERRKVEARWLSRRVAARLHGDERVRDRQNGETRCPHAGDVVFLFRTLRDVSHYVAALAREGIEAHVGGGSSFHDQQEILDVVNLLAAIEDPLDALALAAALRGPFFCLSDDGLYWLATRHLGDLALGLEECDRVAELSEADGGRATRAREMLGRWRESKDRMPAAALIEAALAETGFEAALFGEFLGERKRANVRRLVRLARRHDAGGATFAELVSRLKADLRDPPREDRSASADDHGRAVRLLTIHQAKGLEFPIVVLPDLDRKTDDARAWAVLHPELGPLVRLPSDGEDRGQSQGWKAFDALEEAEDEQEALRLFYVATTRARDALILSAGMATGQRPKAPASRLLAERFDLASGTLRVALPDGMATPRIRVTTTPPDPVAHHAKVPRRRPRLLAVSRLIRRTEAEPGDVPSPPIVAPRVLDLDPSRSLSPRLARVDRLIRVALAHPGPDARRSLERAARGQSPAASRRVVVEARARLEHWSRSDLARAVADSIEVRRAIDWSRVVGETVVHGRLDIAFRDAGGAWRPVVIALAESDPEREELRLRLSMTMFGPCGAGWVVRLGMGIEELTTDERRLAEMIEKQMGLADPPQHDRPRPVQPRDARVFAPGSGRGG